jgi:hypothetical protein
MLDQTGDSAMTPEEPGHASRLHRGIDLTLAPMPCQLFFADC